MGLWLSKVLIYVMTDLYPSSKLFPWGKPEPVRGGRKKNDMLVKVLQVDHSKIK